MRLPGGDMPLRLASLALAAGLWFVIAGRQTAERGLSVPVELRNVPRELELTGDPVNTVDVRVRASPGLIDSLDARKVLATIDLAGAQEGERIVQLTPARIQVPFGFRVVKITPSLLTLNLESTRRKVVPVRPRVIGRPADGFEVSSVTSDPPQVRVAGPRSRVQEIESAFTEPVSVEAADHTVQEAVNVGLEDPLLRLEGGSRVQVTARVAEVRETRVFERLPVVARGRPARLVPARVTVVVSGTAAQLKGLQASAVRPWVEVPAGERASRQRLAVELEAAPPGVSVVEVRPADVDVRPLRRSGGER
ncbi:MAG: CdaR family protein [Betaproteobacteria bacterium]